MKQALIVLVAIQFFQFTAIAAERSIYCQTLSGEYAEITIISESIFDKSRESDIIIAKVEAMENNDFNVVHASSAGGALYIREETGEQLPSVWIQVSNNEELGSLRIVFEDSSLTQAELSFYSESTEAITRMAHLACF